MRDPNRIQPFMDRLAAVWRKVPDWRFGQLMCNTLGSAGIDPFFVDDNRMIEAIEQAVDSMVPGQIVNNHIEQHLK